MNSADTGNPASGRNTEGGKPLVDLSSWERPPDKKRRHCQQGAKAYVGNLNSGHVEGEPKTIAT
jgi:hypothetical protein